MDINKIVRYAIPALVVVGLGFAATKYLDLEKTLQAIKAFNYFYAPALLSAASIYLLAKDWRFIVLIRPVANLGWRPLLKVYLSGRAAALVPGGSAARVALLKQAGVEPEISSAPIALSSLLDYVVFIIVIIGSALWLPQLRLGALIVSVVIATIGLILAIPVTRQKLYSVVDDLARKTDLLNEWREMATSFKEIVEINIILKGLLLTLISLGLYVSILYLSFKSLGATISYPSLVIAVSLPTVLGRLSGLPGGIGVTGASMLGVLVSFSDVSYYVGAITIIIFRIATILFSVVVGLVIYLFVWDGEEETARVVT